MSDYFKEVNDYQCSNGTKDRNIVTILKNIALSFMYNESSNPNWREQFMEYASENLVRLVSKVRAEEMNDFCQLYLKNKDIFPNDIKSMVKFNFAMSRRVRDFLTEGKTVNAQMCAMMGTIVDQFPKYQLSEESLKKYIMEYFNGISDPLKISLYKELKGISPECDEKMYKYVVDNIKECCSYQDAEALSGSIKFIVDGRLFANDIDSFIDTFEFMQARAMDAKNPQNMDEATLRNCKMIQDYFEKNISKLAVDESSIKEMIEKANVPLVFMIIERYKNEPIEGLRAYMNEVIERRSNSYAMWIMMKSKCYDTVFDSRDYDEGYVVQNYEVIKQLYEEILKSEGKQFIDIDVIGRSGSSTVYRVGDKVIKIGKPRVNPQIPAHRRLIQPLVRFEIDGTCIEIQEAAEIVANKINKWRDMYPIYSEMLDEGIMWGDPKPENIGRLQKDNVAILNGKKVDISPDEVNYIVNEDYVAPEPLKAGELVIIDTDYVFYETDIMKAPNYMIDCAIEFYDEYKREHPDWYDENGKRKPETIVKRTRPQNQKAQKVSDENPDTGPENR